MAALLEELKAHLKAEKNMEDASGGNGDDEEQP
jgi:hypothetical protein